MSTKKHTGGYSLVELLVAMSIFLVAVIVGVGVVLAVVNYNKRVQGMTAVMNNLNFALESMSRDIRTGTRYYCGTRTGGNVTATRDCTATGNPVLSFTDEDGVGRYYYLSGETLMESIGSYGNNEMPLSGSDIAIDSLTFRVVGSALAGIQQPLVEILLAGHSLESNDDLEESFEIQMTLTQRLFDVQ